MKRFIRSLIKVFIVILALLCLSWLGLKYYFTHVNIIADQVRSYVLTDVQAHHNPLLTYNDIPEMFRNAIIETENQRFFTNIGIDFKGTLRAVYVDVGTGQSLQGGSTITQQLIHNTILNNMSKSLTLKFLESIYAIGLYDTISKQETFAFYSNVIYFRHGAYGLYQASETYFGKAPSDLSSGELTMLAGLPNAPSAYDPYNNMTFARARANVMLLYGS